VDAEMKARGGKFLVSARALAVLVVGFSLAGATPLSAQVPTPESVLGFRPGADFELATYEQSLDYFQQLAASSDRVQMRLVGRTSEGRDWWVAIISEPENLALVDEARAAATRLASGRMAPDEARALAHSTLPIVDINGGLHASEVAGAQHTIQLAYDLATSDDPRIATIRENVITVLWPSLNPDGQTMVADWYASNLGTPYEVAPMPKLYQKYIGHDNNRDAYMVNMLESRVLARVWADFEPVIIYVHHQSSPFPIRIWLPPFAEPVAPRVPALMSRQVNTIGMAIASLLESRGQEGATHMGTGFDSWYPGYVDYMPMLQHRIAYWTETGLYRYATPQFYTVRDFPQSRRDLRPQSLYSSPWEGGWWRLGDAVGYMLTGSIATLDYAAKYRNDLLFNKYQSAREVVETFEADPPFAYFIPTEQRDPVAAVEMLRRLAYNGVRVAALDSDITLDGVRHPAGSWVIPMDQPLGELVRQLMEPQVYPDLREYPEGPPEQPYDAAGWTLPYQMDVRVIAGMSPLDTSARDAMSWLEETPLAWDADVADASSFDSPRGVGFDDNAVAAAIRPPEGRLTGSGNTLVLDMAQNNAFRALNRAWDLGATVRYAAGDSAAGTSGSYRVTGLSGADTKAMVSDFALQVRRGSAAGTVVARPRVGLYRPWTASMDEGWTRWLLESYGFDFQNVYNAEMRAGRLSERFDVLILPSEFARTFTEGFREGSLPARYAGGLAGAGVRALERFVREGGTVVGLSRASDFLIDALHLPVTNAVADLNRTEFFSRGSLLSVEVDVSHPVMGGMPDRGKIFFDQSPVFEMGEDFEGRVLASYQEAGSPLLSGYLLGEDHLNGKAAAIEVRHGEGRVILLGFRPQWRGQPFGTFRTLFNAALYSGEIAGAR
jgi:zinc carboxypeptidase